MGNLSLALLGPFLAYYGEQTFSHLRGRAGQALLILLAVEGRPQQREQLVELLWPGMPLASGRKNLRQVLYELRQTFPEVDARDGGGRVPLLLSDRQTIGLNPQTAVSLDITQFEALLHSREVQDLEQAVDLYRGDFLSDFFLPDSNTFEEWVAGRRAAYRREVLEALDRLAEEGLRQAQPTSGQGQGLRKAQPASGQGQGLRKAQWAEGYARRALEIDDLRETAVRQLMRALVSQDQRPEALQAFGDFELRLRDALDVAPAAETAILYEGIREEMVGASTSSAGVLTEASTGSAGVLPGASTSSAGVLTGVSTGSAGVLTGASTGSASISTGSSTDSAGGIQIVHNLPTPATPFIGRKRELAEVEALLLAPESRLLTILGAGGIGKSRLALAVAAQMVGSGAFIDGVWFVRMAALDEEAQIVPAITAELPFDTPGSGDLERSLHDYLRDKKLLLLLDNMEQLLKGAPPQSLQAIISAAPEVTVLTTSRAQLHLQGEQIYPLTGLKLPASGVELAVDETAEWGRQYDALHLFEVCARRTRPVFSLNSDNLTAVLRIARRVEGFPLGLEMAAAWIELLSPAEIDEQLSESFDLLEADWPSELGRHQSARAVFEWSWRLLGEAERSLCEALSVFRSGFSREAGLAVGQASLRSLLGLSRKSWLQQGADGRFHIHELLRQYATEKLADDAAMQQDIEARHAHYFASYYRQLGKAMQGGDQRRTLDAIDADFENARTAWYWFKDQKRYEEITNCLLPAMFRLTSSLGKRTELLTLVRDVRDQINGDGADEWNPVKMLALNTAESMLGYDFFGSDIYGPETVVGEEAFEGAWAIVEQQPDGYTAGTWAVYASVIHAWEDRKEGLAALEYLVAEYAARGERWSQAVALQQLGRRLSNRSTDTDPELLRLSRTELVPARDCLEQALALFQTLGDVLEQSRSLGLIGYHVRSADPAAAVTFFERAISLMVEADLPANPSNFAALAQCRLFLGEFEEGFRIFKQMRLRYEKFGNREFLAQTMSIESSMAMRYGDLDLARKLRSRTTKLWQEKAFKASWVYSIYEEGEIERVDGQEALARQKYEQALAMFEETSDSHGLAFCHRGLGELALASKDYKSARRHFERTLILAQSPYVQRWLVSLTCACIGRVLVGLGENSEARTYFAKGIALPKLGEADWFDLLLVSLSGIVELLLVEGNTEQAVALAAFVIHHVATWHEVRWRMETAVEKAKSELPAPLFAAVQERGRKMTLDDAFVSTGLA